MLVTTLPMAKLAQQRRSLLDIAKTIHGPRPKPNAPLGTRHTSHTWPVPVATTEPGASGAADGGAQQPTDAVDQSEWRTCSGGIFPKENYVADKRRTEFSKERRVY